jgi:hypothetical protein
MWRLRRRWTAALGAFLVIVTTALTVAGIGHANDARSRHAATLSRSEMKTLTRLASQFASGNGDARPTSTTVVRTTRAKALRILAGGDEVVQGKTFVYAIEMRGEFTGYLAKTPGGQALPVGSALFFIVDSSTGKVLDWGINTEGVDLQTVGPVAHLRLPT